jgi:hypothetical protein
MPSRTSKCKKRIMFDAYECKIAKFIATIYRVILRTSPNPTPDPNVQAAKGVFDRATHLLTLSLLYISNVHKIDAQAVDIYPLLPHDSKPVQTETGSDEYIKDTHLQVVALVTEQPRSRNTCYK